VEGSALLEGDSFVDLLLVFAELDNMEIKMGF